MKLNMKEKKILYAYACPSHHNTVTRLKWLTALTVDPEEKSQMLQLARKIDHHKLEGGLDDFLYLHLQCQLETQTGGFQPEVPSAVPLGTQYAGR